MRLLPALFLALLAFPAATVWWHDDGPLGPAFYVDAPEGRFAFALPQDAQGPPTWRGLVGQVGWATLPEGRALGLAWEGGPRWVRLEVADRSLRQCAAQCRFGEEGGWVETPLPRAGLLPLGLVAGTLAARGADSLWLLPPDGTGSVRSLSEEEMAAGAWLAAGEELLFAPTPPARTKGEWFPWGIEVEKAEYRFALGDFLLMAFYESGVERVFKLSVQPPSPPLDLYVVAEGSTEAEAADTLTATWVESGKVDVVALGLGPYQATVLGAVQKPGPIAAEDPHHLHMALSAALPRPDADLSRVEVRSPDGSWETTNLFRLLSAEARVPILLPRGAVVFVPFRPLVAVHVLGAVGHPGPVVWVEGTTVATAVAAAGGLGDTDRNVALLVPASGEARNLILAPDHPDWETKLAAEDALLVFYAGDPSGRGRLEAIEPLLSALLSSARTKAILDSLTTGE